MSLSAAQIAAVIEEVAGFVGAPVRKVFCEDASTFVLEVRAPGENAYLLLSLREGVARFHLVASKPQQAPEPAAFVMLLRKHLVGARVRSVEPVGRDRLVRVGFERRSAPGADVEQRTLLAELTARHGNVFLLDADDRVLGSLRSNRSRRRNLVVGERYVSPPSLEGAALEAAWKDDLALGELPADGSRSRRLEEFCTRRLVRAHAVRTAHRVLRRLRREAKALRKREQAVSSDLDRALEAQRYRRWGELLQAAHGKVPRGADVVRVPDYYAVGADGAAGPPEVEVPLDPKLDLKGNIQRYFRLYRKYRAAIDGIETRRAQLASRLERLESSLARAAQLAPVATGGEVGADSRPSNAGERPTPEAALEQLEFLEAELEGDGILRPHRGAGQSAGKAPPGKATPYREFTSKTGKTILVGKGSKQNDTLTLRIARGSDLWLHARDWPGSHVVVRLERKEEFDEDTLLDAATLAAFYSRGKKAGVVDVGYTRAKHVRKPKGAGPGKVTYAKGKTIGVRMEKERLDRLLGR